MSVSVLLIDIEDGITTLPLNCPAARHALSRGLQAKRVETFDALGKCADVGVVILTGACQAWMIVRPQPDTGLTKLSPTRLFIARFHPWVTAW